MSVAEPLHRTVQSLTFTDTEVRRIGTLASREASNVMKTLQDKGTTSAHIRSAQIAMAKINAEMWANIGDATKVGIGDAVWNATEMQALFDENLFKSVGFDSQYWRASMIASSKQGVESLISRKQNGLTLSEKVYKSQALSKGVIDDLLNTGLLLGKSPAEIAKSVVGFIDPAVPGGASYAANRLARTEVNNAFHTTSLRRYGATPWVDLVQWHLSGSHSRPDACNEYAESVHTPKQGAGVFRILECPDKPHPNCLCYVTPVAPNLDKFAKDFQAGKYDDYIDNQMGCYRVAS